MNIKLVTDIKEAREVWEKLSPHKTIDDEWDFRYTFFKYLPYKLHFFVGYEGDEPVALIPLQMNTGFGLMPPYSEGEKSFLEFFGGDDTDDNTIFTTKEYAPTLKDFLSNLKIPTYLAPLNISYRNFGEAEFYENKFYLNLENYKNHEDFLIDKWSSDSRKKIRQQIRKLYREHKIEVVENDYSDIDLLVELNQKRFGNESSFKYLYRKLIFQDLTGLYNVLTSTIVVDGKKTAVSFGIHYKEAYVGMNAGVNPEIPDLAKLLILHQIDKAIALGCKIYDAGKGDSGWKENFKLEKIPQYQLSIPQ